MKRRKTTKIRSQLYGVYVLTLLIPLTVIGLILILSARQTLSDYYLQLLEMDNSRVKTLLSEITARAYKVSNELCFSTTLRDTLGREYEDSSEFLAAVNQYNSAQSQAYNSLDIAGVYIYTDNPTIKDYRQFRSVTDEIAASQWYQKTLKSANAFWMAVEGESTQGTNNNLCLIRRVNLIGTDYHAVAVVQISDTYIRSRMDSGGIVDVVSVDDQGIVYSSSTSLYGKQLPVDIDHSKLYYRNSGLVTVEGKRYFSAVSTINLYRTNSKMYVCTLDNSGIAEIRSITTTGLLVLLLAMLVPLVIIMLYATYFSRRLGLLREEMHKASQQDYNIIAGISGNDELTEAFEDLKIMVRDIKEKNARMYEAELNEQALRSRQQLMEYKVLSSQINPHYLYNTLETIRMKALTVGDRQVADAIKLLGKTLHYVQENTGIAFTTLKKELDHVENYLAIQRLRFGERINYSLQLDPGVDPEEQSILPLLLQPLVENAVVHGLETVDGIGMVTVTVRKEDSLLHIDVCDSGTGMEPEQLENLRKGLNASEMPRSSIALYNIHQRIRLRYGEAYGIQIGSAPGKGTCIRLTIPAQ